MHPLPMKFQALLCVLLLAHICPWHSHLLKYDTKAHVLAVFHCPTWACICMHFHGWFQVLHQANYWDWNSAHFLIHSILGLPYAFIPWFSTLSWLVKKKVGWLLSIFYVCFAYINLSINFWDCFICLSVKFWQLSYRHQTTGSSFLGCDHVCNLSWKRPNYL
jgi:hypothetical protein